MFNLLRTMLICYCCFCCCSFGADFAFAFADDFEHFFFLHFTIKSEEKEEKTVLNILYLYIERYNCIMKNIKKTKKKHVNDLVHEPVLYLVQLLLPLSRFISIMQCRLLNVWQCDSCCMCARSPNKSSRLYLPPSISIHFNRRSCYNILVYKEWRTQLWHYSVFCLYCVIEQ